MDKKGEKNEKKIRRSRKDPAELSHSLEEACAGLVYISETDSPVTVYMGPKGAKLSELSTSTIAPYINDDDLPIEEASFEGLFERLTADKDWHGARERKRAKKFLDLQRMIEENLDEPKVFRVGRTRVRIYTIGLNEEGRAVGVVMDAVET